MRGSSQNKKLALESKANNEREISRSRIVQFKIERIFSGGKILMF